VSFLGPAVLAGRLTADEKDDSEAAFRDDLFRRHDVTTDGPRSSEGSLSSGPDDGRRRGSQPLDRTQGYERVFPGKYFLHFKRLGFCEDGKTKKKCYMINKNLNTD
jgi:hypothetical protein